MQAKASSPISFKVSGRQAISRESHLLKAFVPTFATSSNLTYDKDLQPSKAPSPTDSAPLISAYTSDVQKLSRCGGISLSQCRSTLCIAVCEKALAPMSARERGSSGMLSITQNEKAESPISVTAPKVTL